MGMQVRLIVMFVIAITSFTGTDTLTLAQANFAIPQESGRSDSFTSQLTRSVVEIADTSEGQFLHEYHASGDTSYGYVQENIVIGHGYSDVMVSFAVGDVNPQQWNDNSINLLPYDNRNYAWVLGAEADVQQSWFLSRHSNFLDLDQHLYSEFHMDIGNGHVAAVYVRASTEDLVTSIQWAQENVTIDGHVVFANADLGEIQAMLDGTSALEPFELEGFTSDVDYWSDSGLISANQWQSPDYGHSVTWDDSTAWGFPFTWDIASKYWPEDAEHRFALARDDHSAFTWVSFFETDGLTASDYEERWSSDEWLAESGRNYPALAATSTATQAGAVTEYTTTFGDLITNIVQGVVLPDGTILFISLSATPEKIVPAYLDLVSILEINGQPVDQLWTQSELEEIIPNAGTASDSITDVSRTSRSAESESATATSGESVTSEVIGVTIDLGPTGDATFDHDAYYTAEGGGVTLESFTVEYGTTVVIIDVLEGDLDVDSYMLNAEADIAATYDYTDWLGGSWTDAHSWDVYSGAYKLDYREIAYLDLMHDPESGLYFGIGIYGRAEDIPADIAWLNQNVSIDGQGIFDVTDTSLIESVIAGTSEYMAEPVPVPETTVADWSDAGLVSETEWHSPFTSTSFTWDGERLVFPFSQPDALIIDAEVASLELRTSDRRGEVRLATAELDLTPAEMVASMTSDEYLQSEAESGRRVEILDSHVSDETGSVIMLHYTDFDHPVVLIVDVYVNPEGITVVTEISAAPEDIAEVYAIVWDSVQSNGDYYPLTWTIEEIEALDA